MAFGSVSSPPDARLYLRFQPLTHSAPVFFKGGSKRRTFDITCQEMWWSEEIKLAIQLSTSRPDQTLTVYEDGQHDSCPELKTARLDRPLLADFSTGR